MLTKSVPRKSGRKPTTARNSLRPGIAWRCPRDTANQYRFWLARALQHQIQAELPVMLDLPAPKLRTYLPRQSSRKSSKPGSS